MCVFCQSKFKGKLIIRLLSEMTVSKKSNLDESKLNMNGVANSIWNAIEKPIQIKKIVDFLYDEYDVDKETCEETTITFLSRLNHAGLIDVFELKW